MATILAVEEIAERKSDLVMKNEGVDYLDHEHYNEYDLEDEIDAEIRRSLHAWDLERVAFVLE